MLACQLTPAGKIINFSSANTLVIKSALAAFLLALQLCRCRLGDAETGPSISGQAETLLLQHTHIQSETTDTCAHININTHIQPWLTSKHFCTHAHTHTDAHIHTLSLFCHQAYQEFYCASQYWVIRCPLLCLPLSLTVEK